MALYSREFIEGMRPRQWQKNGLLLAGLVFAGRFRNPESVAVLLADVTRVIIAVLAFCLFSSATYVLNDIIDRESDKSHPDKCERPIASGRLPVSSAFAGACTLAAVGAALAVYVSLRSGSYGFLLMSLFYLLLTVSYSFWFKHWVIVDVLVLSAGFVLRVAAGCMSLPVDISPWLVLCTLFLALFMGLCKRRHEILLLGENSVSTRKVLPHYTAQLLDQMIAAVTALTIMAYSLYTFNADHTVFLGRESPWVMLTIPFVMYGVFRYLYLVYRKDLGGTPEDVFTDRPMLINLLLWGLIVVYLSVKAPG